MRLPEGVRNDLLTVYLAGEASPETRVLVEEWARDDQVFAAAMHAAAQVDIKPAAATPSADLEIRSLKMTRQFVRLRSILMAMAIFFSLLPFSFAFGSKNGFSWLVWDASPGLGIASVSLAVASWVAWHVMNRRVKRAGL